MVGPGPFAAGTLRLFVPPQLNAAALASRLAGARIETLSGRTMGTGWSLRYVAPPGVMPEAVSGAVNGAWELVIAQMSNWEGDSSVSRFNRAPAGSWHVLPPELFHVLTSALAVAAASGGAFDPTLGALVDLWGFGAIPAAVLPPQDDDVAGALRAAGWERLKLDRYAQRAQQPGGVRLDLSGVAKGYAVDLAAGRLRAAGVRHFLIEAGGELRGEGVKPDGSPWWVDIESPAGAGGRSRVAIHQKSLATSGDYRRFFSVDGRRYAHSIDPRNGRPVAHALASVTVVHSDCMMADAFATALTVLGPEQGMRFAEDQGLAALFVARDGAHLLEALSPALAAMLS